MCGTEETENIVGREKRGAKARRDAGEGKGREGKKAVADFYASEPACAFTRSIRNTHDVARSYLLVFSVFANFALHYVSFMRIGISIMRRRQIVDIIKISGK